MEQNRNGMDVSQCRESVDAKRSIPRFRLLHSDSFPTDLFFGALAIAFVVLFSSGKVLGITLQESANQQSVRSSVLLSTEQSRAILSDEAAAVRPATTSPTVTESFTNGSTAFVGPTSTEFVSPVTASSLQQSLAIKSSLRTRRSGDPQVVSFRPEDEVWVVSARDSHHCPDDLSLLKVSQLINGQLHPKHLFELVTAHQTDPGHETILFVHGNRTDKQWAIARGSQVYENLFRKTCGEAPVRYIIWLWASEPELGRPIKDYKLKSKRAVAVGHTLARFLQQFPDRDLMLIGYSLGVQSIMSALADAELNQPKPGAGYRLNLIASAIDCQFAASLTRCRPLGSIVSQTNIFHNSNDRIVALANKICRKSYGREAIFVDSIAKQRLIDLGDVSFYEISHEVAAKHSIVMYSQSPTLKAVLSNNRFSSTHPAAITPAE